ncbi:MAG TPA: hypothetical protein ENI79_00630, partial [Rhodospirillales bacterium]|nr:hypothetical protein [Rhodospirillales bacterium]
MRKLQVWRTIKDANVFIYAHKDFFWRLAILPMCIYFAVYFVYFITVGKGVAMSMADFSMQSHSGAGTLANFPMKDFLLSLVPAFILSLLTLPFIVAWRRLAL